MSTREKSRKRERVGNGCFGPSIVGWVFQQIECMPGQMTVEEQEEGPGVRHEVRKGCSHGFFKSKRLSAQNEGAKVN